MGAGAGANLAGSRASRHSPSRCAHSTYRSLSPCPNASASSACSPIAGANVEIWHVAAAGDYSQYGTQRAATFLRGIHVVDYTEAALKDMTGHVITLAEAENLPAHGEAVRRRFER